MTNTQGVILIFQIGSMGDTVISMPCYREIARRHPNSARYLLTNHPIGHKMVPAATILGGTGLISASLEYPMPLRGTTAITALYKKLLALRAITLYYLTPETRLNRLLRHYVFFRLCGIRDIRGVPWTRDLQYPRQLAEGNWESEGSRLLRCIRARDEPGHVPTIDRSLDLSSDERGIASRALLTSLETTAFIAISAGGKMPIKDWGDVNWKRLLSRITSEHPELGIVFVGSADERARNDLLAEVWNGPKFNTCGLFSARQTAALLERARLFIGHDTGTLHLTATTETPIIGIYSARDLPGKWFSDRPSDTFFYKRVQCFGCGCIEVTQCPNNRECITSIGPDDVFAVVRERLKISPSCGLHSQ